MIRSSNTKTKIHVYIANVVRSICCVLFCEVDVAYGADAGFSEAIEKSKDVLANTRFVKEKKVVGMLSLDTKT